MSVLESLDILIADLQKQLQHNRLVQMNPDSEPQLVISPLELIPKHDGGWRRIHDLSSLYGNSVNDHISQEWGTLEYVTFDEAIDALLLRGREAVFVKRDLKV